MPDQTFEEFLKERAEQHQERLRLSLYLALVAAGWVLEPWLWGKADDPWGCTWFWKSCPWFQSDPPEPVIN
jgi:hypothetical protein